MESRGRSADLPKAVVLVSGGTGEGALCVVRGLGRMGVPITVLAERPGTHAAASRYCQEATVVPALSRQPDQALSFLLAYARGSSPKPVLFPTADSDLVLLSQLQDRLAGSYHLVIPSKEHVDTFVDKARFHLVAEKHGFPVPKTFAPDSAAMLRRVATELRYPVIVKPSGARGWRSETAEAAVRYKKAIRLDTREELLALYDRIAGVHPDLLVQEYIEGPDEAHFDIHIYMDRSSQPVAYFTGQKIRICPAYAGSGCSSGASSWSRSFASPYRCSRRWDTTASPTSTSSATRGMASTS